ncbi:hypothetical protein [Moraxella cuniculi]|uniref:hypothetical protein n=1 Tax=Moraxella cuniculi TaxID=34061 RepID=UPI0014735C40|nr:hypothetical protein [Moraxella cuniculi]
MAVWHSIGTANHSKRSWHYKFIDCYKLYLGLGRAAYGEKEPLSLTAKGHDAKPIKGG